MRAPPPRASGRMLTALPEPEQLAREQAFREGASDRQRGVPRAANRYRRPVAQRTVDSDLRYAAWDLGWITEDRKAQTTMTKR